MESQTLSHLPQPLHTTCLPSLSPSTPTVFPLIIPPHLHARRVCRGESLEGDVCRGCVGARPRPCTQEVVAQGRRVQERTDGDAQFGELLAVQLQEEEAAAAAAAAAGRERERRDGRAAF